MSFGENLRTVRKERNISQEELAAQLHVSRQAISRWEQGNGYPEMEKMITLSRILKVSLDYLVSDQSDSQKQAGPASESPSPASPAPAPAAVSTGKIMIRSHDGKQLVNCYKVMSMRVSSHPDAPHFALFGVDSSSFWGENRTMLGWYAHEADVQKETAAISQAMLDGKTSYELQYAAKVKESFLRVSLVREEDTAPEKGRDTDI